MNVKSLNHFGFEKTNSEKSPTTYAQNTNKSVSTPGTQPHSSYFNKSLGEQITDSATSFRRQFINIENLKQKVFLTYFNFGRYITSSLGLTRYSMVYESNSDSLKPIPMLIFPLVGFLFLILFLNRKRIPDLFFVLLFFIPVSGLFYVPYMRHSFVADHWFYLSLPFLLSFIIINRSKKIQYPFVILISTQFITTLFLFSSTDNAIKKSFETYKNPFLYTYMLDFAKQENNNKMIYALADIISEVKSGRDEAIIKLKLLANLQELKNPLLEQDLKNFINYSILNKDYQVAQFFLREHGNHMSSTEVSLYEVLIEALQNKMSEESINMIKRSFKEVDQ